MMNWKGFGSKRSWPNFRYYTGICLEVLRENTKNITQDSRSLDRDLKLRSQNTKQVCQPLGGDIR
jgi:hypothetical protein